MSYCMEKNRELDEIQTLKTVRLDIFIIICQAHLVYGTHLKVVSIMYGMCSEMTLRIPNIFKSFDLSISLILLVDFITAYFSSDVTVSYLFVIGKSAVVTKH